LNRRITYRTATLIGLALLLAATGCSRKKDKFTSRFYHQMTSQYNWYFNANELWEATNLQLWTEKQDDYLAVLPVFVVPNEDQQKNLFPQMDAIIEKCGTMIDRHSMEISKKEKNKWIDDAYVLTGKANFYKGRYSTAQEMFAYVAKKYKGQSSRYEAALWLARCYFESDRFGKANTVLSVIEKDMSEDRPKDFDASLYTVYADMYLRQGKYKEAVPYLEDAVLATDDRQMKARLTYILAQAYQQEGKSAQAIATFAEVVSLKPGYEMEFYAKISQALAFDRKLDSSKIKDMLRTMSREEKYKEYLDQIYYAWAEIELEERNIEEGLRLLELSASSSVNNPKQKAKTFLRIADIYFTDREYLTAKNYYDSTATLITEDFPGYYDILAKASSLGDLVKNLDIVETNDSLLNLANMDEKEREKLILKMIADLEAEFERKKKEEQEALERLQFASTSGAGSGTQSYGSGKNWYFYNPSALGNGLQQFKKRWGNRKLEDNWRRSIKSSTMDAVADAKPDALEMGEEMASGILTLEEYIEMLPLSDSAQSALGNEVIEALYNIGLIYKERLKDEDNAIESFLRITVDYDTSATAPSAYYQLYRIYYEKELSGSFVGTGFKDNSDYYKDIILSDYPDSEYAKLILNPDYVSQKNANYAAEKLLYEELFKKYNQRQYNDVLVACNKVISSEPDNNFLPKYYLIKALTVGAKNDPTTFENVLKEIIAKFPGTEEAAKASELLGDLNDAKARLAREQSKPDTADADTDATADAPAAAADVNTSMFALDDNSEHFFALIFPKESENATTVKETIAQFNSEFYQNANLRVTNSFIDKDHQIVIVRSFKNKADALEYYQTFNRNKGILQALVDKNYPTFTITTKNFTVLFRNKNPEVYQAFFQTNYL
jgi:TolA-binding protein